MEIVLNYNGNQRFPNSNGMDRDGLYDHLDHNSQVLRNQGVRDAFAAVDRADFLHEDYKPEAYEDYAVPAGHGQHVTKPTLAAFMLELLGAEKGERVLEVGSGSGWVTALLADMVGKEGSIVATESIPELVEQGRANMAKYDYPQANIEHAGRELGSAQNGLYDRILVMADADSIPGDFLAQLKEGGTLVLPVGGCIVKVEKKDGRPIETKYPGTFEFSPLS